jgi:hypothetical protein
MDMMMTEHGNRLLLSALRFDAGISAFTVSASAR